MILGVGVDIVAVSRIESAMQDPKFLTRIFTPAEIDEIKDGESAAGRWAAKEAIIKAVGRKVPWQKIEILRGGHGKPIARIRDEADCANARVHVSIAHDGGMATAFAVLEEAS